MHARGPRVAGQQHAPPALDFREHLRPLYKRALHKCLPRKREPVWDPPDRLRKLGLQ